MLTGILPSKKVSESPLHGVGRGTWSTTIMVIGAWLVAIGGFASSEPPHPTIHAAKHAPSIQVARLLTRLLVICRQPLKPSRDEICLPASTTAGAIPLAVRSPVKRYAGPETARQATTLRV